MEVTLPQHAIDVTRDVANDGNGNGDGNGDGGSGNGGPEHHSSTEEGVGGGLVRGSLPKDAVRRHGSLHSATGSVCGCPSVGEGGGGDGSHSFASSLPLTSTPTPALSALLSRTAGREEGEETPWVSPPQRRESHPRSVASRLFSKTDGPSELVTDESEVMAAELLGVHADVHFGCNASSSAAELALPLVADVTYKGRLKERVWDRWAHRFDEREAHRRHLECLGKEYHDRNVRYLFFRAWQWRFHTRRARRARRATAAEMERRVLSQSALRQWSVFCERRRRGREAAARLKGQQEERLVSSSMMRWRLWCERRELARALVVVCRETHLAQRLRDWVSFTLWTKRNGLLVSVARLHTPSSWGSASTREEERHMGKGGQRRGGGGGGGGAAEDFTMPLVLHSCWLQWLRVTGERRGKRLQRYAECVASLQRARERAVMEYTWQRWLLHTASAAQCRRHVAHLRSVYLHRWTSLVLSGRAADRHRRAVQRGHLRGLLHLWRERAASSLRNRRDEGAALAYYQRQVRMAHQRTRCFDVWRGKWQRRVRERHLVEAGVQARRELLQHLGMRRLVEGVLLDTNAVEGEKENHFVTGEWATEDAGSGGAKRKTLTAPLPLRSSVSAVSQPAVKSATSPHFTSRTALPTAAVALVHRGTSPVSMSLASCGKTSKGTQTDAVATRLQRPLSNKRSRRRLPLPLRRAPGEEPEGRAARSFLSPPPKLLFSWRAMATAEIQAQGKAVVSAYRTLEASMANEREESLLLELEREQLRWCLLHRCPTRSTAPEDDHEGEDSSDHDDDGEDGLPLNEREVRSARARLQSLEQRLRFLALRDEQRRRLRQQVEELARELSRRTEAA